MQSLRRFFKRSLIRTLLLSLLLVSAPSPSEIHGSTSFAIWQVAEFAISLAIDAYHVVQGLETLGRIAQMANPSVDALDKSKQARKAIPNETSALTSMHVVHQKQELEKAGAISKTDTQAHPVVTALTRTLPGITDYKPSTPKTSGTITVEVPSKKVKVKAGPASRGFPLVLETDDSKRVEVTLPYPSQHSSQERNSGFGIDVSPQSSPFPAFVYVSERFNFSIDPVAAYYLLKNSYLWLTGGALPIDSYQKARCIENDQRFEHLRNSSDESDQQVVREMTEKRNRLQSLVIKATSNEEYNEHLSSVTTTARQYQALKQLLYVTDEHFDGYSCVNDELTLSGFDRYAVNQVLHHLKKIYFDNNGFIKTTISKEDYLAAQHITNLFLSQMARKPGHAKTHLNYDDNFGIYCAQRSELHAYLEFIDQCDRYQSGWERRWRDSLTGGQATDIDFQQIYARHEELFESTNAAFQKHYRELFDKNGILRSCAADPLYKNMTAKQKRGFRNRGHRQRRLNAQLAIRNEMKIALEQQLKIPEVLKSIDGTIKKDLKRKIDNHIYRLIDLRMAGVSSPQLMEYVVNTCATQELYPFFFDDNGLVKLRRDTQDVVVSGSRSFNRYQTTEEKLLLIKLNQLSVIPVTDTNNVSIKKAYNYLTQAVAVQDVAVRKRSVQAFDVLYPVLVQDEVTVDQLKQSCNHADAVFEGRQNVVVSPVATQYQAQPVSQRIFYPSFYQQSSVAQQKADLDRALGRFKNGGSESRTAQEIALDAIPDNSIALPWMHDLPTDEELEMFGTWDEEEHAEDIGDSDDAQEFDLATPDAGLMPDGPEDEDEKNTNNDNSLNLRQFDESIGDLKKLERAYKLFKDTPGAIGKTKDGPLGRVLRYGKKGSDYQHLQMSRGVMYELETALDLVDSGEKIIEFSLKYGGREFDIVTERCLIECKNVNWDRILSSKKELDTFYSDIGSKESLSKLFNKVYRFYSKKPIPENIRSWLIKKGIKFFEG